MIRSLSVLTKSGPMGEWRRAKTEVSSKSNEFHLFLSAGSEEITIRASNGSVFQDITSGNE